MKNQFDHKLKKKRGFSLVEVLVAIAIFGVLMSALVGVLNANSGATSQQVSNVNASLAARLSMLRITEIVSQAHYIYPAGQTLTMNLKSGNSSTIVTGQSSLAVLLPEGTTYCTDPNGKSANGQQYCGYVFSIEDRSMFSNLLGNAKHETDSVLVAWRSFNIDWVKSAVPSTALGTWTGVERQLLADSVVPVSAGTNLGGADILTVSEVRPKFDRDIFFSYEESDTNQATGLIRAVTPYLGVRLGKKESEAAFKRTHIVARSIPRGALPNPD